MTEKITWEKAKQLYEQKIKSKLKSPDLSTPELVMKYIEKHDLYSSSEVKLLSTPELVMKYIEKHDLYSSSAKIIFSANRVGK